MAQIKRYPFASHIRSEASSHVTYYRGGKARKSGRGLSFWFDPNGASISEVPMADRELTFMVKNQSADYQDLAAQGAVLWRVADAKLLADRVNFTINLKSGQPLAKPEDQIRSILSGLVREFSDTYLKALGVREALDAGLAPLQSAIRAGFASDPTLGAMGLEVISVRVAALSPSSELARALQAPTFESLQQKADEATFARRALAVDKERAIAENEMANEIELAKRRSDLIAKEDANARSKAEAEAASLMIMAESEAQAKVISAEAEATRIRAVDQAEADMQKAHMEAIGSVPTEALFALAARDFAGKLERIDSISISPDMLGGLIKQVRDMSAPSGG